MKKMFFFQRNKQNFQLFIRKNKKKRKRKKKNSFMVMNTSKTFGGLN